MKFNKEMKTFQSHFANFLFSWELTEDNEVCSRVWSMSGWERLAMVVDSLFSGLISWHDNDSEDDRSGVEDIWTSSTDNGGDYVDYKCKVSSVIIIIDLVPIRKAKQMYMLRLT